MSEVQLEATFIIRPTMGRIVWSIELSGKVEATSGESRAAIANCDGLAGGLDTSELAVELSLPVTSEAKRTGLGCCGYGWTKAGSSGDPGI